jgi:hypothetical protein
MYSCGDFDELQLPSSNQLLILLLIGDIGCRPQSGPISFPRYADHTLSSPEVSRKAMLRINPYVVLLTLIATLGGLLFGGGGEPQGLFY